MRDESKDQGSDKEVITEKDGKKKVLEANKANFEDRDHHRKNERPAFTADTPTAAKDRR